MAKRSAAICPTRLIWVCRRLRGCRKVTREFARSNVGCQACLAIPKHRAGILTARPTLRMVNAYFRPFPISPMTLFTGIYTSVKVVWAFSMPRHPSNWHRCRIFTPGLDMSRMNAVWTDASAPSLRAWGPIPSSRLGIFFLPGRGPPVLPD